MNLRIWMAFFLLIPFLAGCKEDDCCSDPVDFKYDFFPLGEGLTSTFHIDSVVFLSLGEEKAISSFIQRETIMPADPDLDEKMVHKIRIERYDSLENRWVTTGFEHLERSKSSLEQTEENFRYVKLGFPAVEGQSWKGNIFFDSNIEVVIGNDVIQPFKDWPEEYFISEISESETIGDQTYAKVATVVHVDHDFDLEKRYSVEKYAFGVGLVFKEMVILDTQCTKYQEFFECLDAPWTEKGERGFILRKSRID